MAHNSNLPCDGDGICMVCKNKAPENETLTCNTCVTPWHITCLSDRPETLADAAQWHCPDCSLISEPVAAGNTAVSGRSDLISAIRAIQDDQSLTEREKAKKRQELLTGEGGGDDSTTEANRDKAAVKGDNDILHLMDASFNCSICMLLPERPVTTPCGHNFCLKCFQKWVGQGKSTCANCRGAIPRSMATNPRINSSLVTAIRMAKMSRANVSGGPPKVYHFVHNQNRPDKAYTTERAKKSGNANACSGKIFVTVPSDHFGPIVAENDPERNLGVLVGETWVDRMECRQWGAHLPHVAGISGQADHGAQSVALSGGYEDDEDHGEWFLYTGSGGRDLSGNKRTNKTQSFDQKFDKQNEALRLSCRKGYPVRVVRSHKEKRSSYAPEKGVRYDGIYRIEKCWRKPGIQGPKVCRYLFVRCDNEPAPWTSDEHGDRPRPLPSIEELKFASDITERKGSPSWDYDEEKDSWMWKKPPPESRKHAESGNLEDGKSTRKGRRNTQTHSVREKLLKEFSCLKCRKVMVMPLTTPCAHNFCKACLEGTFAGQTFIRQRTCEGGRTLRAQKNIMKCPLCSTDISDFLQNPQVNRELMNVIESLQRQTKEMEENVEVDEETDEKEEENVELIEENDDSDERLDENDDSDEKIDDSDEKFDEITADIKPENSEEDEGKPDIAKPPVKTETRKDHKRKKADDENIGVKTRGRGKKAKNGA